MCQNQSGRQFWPNISVLSINIKNASTVAEYGILSSCILDTSSWVWFSLPWVYLSKNQFLFKIIVVLSMCCQNKIEISFYQNTGQISNQFFFFHFIYLHHVEHAFRQNIFRLYYIRLEDSVAIFGCLGVCGWCYMVINAKVNSRKKKGKKRGKKRKNEKFSKKKNWKKITICVCVCVCGC